MVLTALVIFHHAAVTYGSAGGWYVHERPSGSEPGLTVFVVLNQAWFMGLFFLIAGHLTPGAVARKGAGRFLRDRAWRLGVPLVVYGLVLDPLTVALAGRRPVWGGFVSALERGAFGVGPLWFAEALLLFAGAYAAFVAGAGRAGDRRFPSDPVLLCAALGCGVAAFAVRSVLPVDRAVAGMTPGYFPAYAVLFAAGIAGAARDWPGTVPGWRAACWLGVSAVAAGLFLGSGSLVGTRGIEGGWSGWALGYAMFEPLFGWGVILALLWGARRFAARPVAAGRWLSRRAFGCYVVHPPVLVGVTRVLHPWAAGPWLKVLASGVAACVGCLVVSSLLLLVPGVRRVL